MTRKLLLITLGFSLLGSGFWALKAQDPPPKVTQDPPATVTKVKPQRAAPTAQTTQADLSGTYAGTFNCEAAGLVGDTTLTINGNEFTTSDGKSGRIVGSTTSGYTAVALQIGGADATAAPTVISLRARKNGNRLTLTPVAGSSQQCSFTTGRSIAKIKRTKRTPAATGTEVSNPATVPTTMPESPMPAQTPSPVPPPSPSPTPTPTPNPIPSPSPTPSGSPTPVPSPTPIPSPEPVPSPTPMPSPTPNEPTPTPTPTPSPSPSPSPRVN